ncbi:Prostaglandin reductase 3 [Desmophyllum pertusum]|uniref:15-oxoprostaglandin 13-reductase n=1 Tax=Desmophyllum pertusum TaxID=174260 RepID=A0A9X0D8Q2_9CNID|nr:Prostaglandin reductase 3 [Desmophyllum pertusum]
MAARQLPETFRKLVISKFSTNYREAVELMTVPMLRPGPDELLVKSRYVGINATDINHSAGRYHPGQSPPLDAGLEGIGEVVSTGEKCTNFHKGQAVGYIKNGTFSEYMTIPSAHVFPLPKVDPAYVALLISGLTAGIALHKVGEMKSKDTVLVTAAAGGTGQFAVQLAKLAGCHVIGTCSTDAKGEFLKSLGCDRPVNYKTEKLDEVLKIEFPKGVDVVYESIGGEMFDTCVNRLATKGRLITIGFITGYQSKLGFTPVKNATLIPKLLARSASVRGFLLYHYAEEYRSTFANFGQASPTGVFKGLDSITDAVEYLHSGKSAGKVVVEIPDDMKSHL